MVADHMGATETGFHAKTNQGHKGAKPINPDLSSRLCIFAFWREIPIALEKADTMAGFGQLVVSANIDKNIGAHT